MSNVPGPYTGDTPPFEIPREFSMEDIFWAHRSHSPEQYIARVRQVQGLWKQMTTIDGVIINGFTGNKFLTVMGALHSAFDGAEKTFSTLDQFLDYNRSHAAQNMIANHVLGTANSTGAQVSSISDNSVIFSTNLDDLVINIPTYQQLEGAQIQFTEGVNMLLLPTPGNDYRVRVQLVPADPRHQRQDEFLQFYQRITQADIPGILPNTQELPFIDWLLWTYDIQATTSRDRTLFPQTQIVVPGLDQEPPKGKGPLYAVWDDSDLLARIDQELAQPICNDLGQEDEHLTSIYHGILERFKRGGTTYLDSVSEQVRKLGPNFPSEKITFLGEVISNYIISNIQVGQLGNLMGINTIYGAFNQHVRIAPEVAHKLEFYYSHFSPDACYNFATAIKQEGYIKAAARSLRLKEEEDAEKLGIPHTKYEQLEQISGTADRRGIKEVQPYQELLSQRMRQWVQERVSTEPVTNAMLREMRYFSEVVLMMHGRADGLYWAKPEVAVPLVKLLEHAVGHELPDMRDRIIRFNDGASSAIRNLPPYNRENIAEYLAYGVEQRPGKDNKLLE